MHIINIALLLLTS